MNFKTFPIVWFLMFDFACSIFGINEFAFKRESAQNSNNNYDYLRTIYGQTQAYLNQRISPNYFESHRFIADRYFSIMGKKFTSNEDEWLKSLRNGQMEILYNKIIGKSGILSYQKHIELKSYLYHNGFSFIIFDCENPKHFYPSGVSRIGEITVDLMQINTSISFIVKKLATCDKGVNVWKQNIPGNKTAYLTLNPKKGVVKYSAKSNILKILALKNLCHDIMKFMLFPSYFNKLFPMPSECVISVNELNNKFIKSDQNENVGRNASNMIKKLAKLDTIINNSSIATQSHFKT